MYWEAVCQTPLVGFRELIRTLREHAVDHTQQTSGSGGGGGRPVTADAGLATALAEAERVVDTLATLDPAQLSEFGLGDQVLRLMRLRRRIDAVTASVSNRYVHTNEAYAHGVKRPADWVAHKSRTTRGEVRSQLRRSAFLDQNFPTVQTAWAAGTLSAGHVDALGRVWRRFPSLRSLLQESVEQVITIGAACDPDTFATYLVTLCHRHDPAAVTDDESAQEKETFLNVSTLGAYRSQACREA